jgi:two-component system sensor histidine kinase YesM
MIKQIKRAFQNLSLNKKILILILAGVILPLGMAFALSVKELRTSTQERQIYAMNQGYNQVYQSLEDRLSRVHNISTLIAVNDTVNLTLKLKEDDMDLMDQLALFEKISSYTYAMELSFESNNIVFYINDKFKIANSQNGRYRKLNLAMDSTWYPSLLKNKGKPTWVPFEDQSGIDKGSYIALARNLWNEDNYEESLGILAVLVEKSAIREVFIDSNKEQFIYMETGEGELLAANVTQEELVRIPGDLRSGNDEGLKTISVNGINYYARSCMIEDTNVYLISMVAVSAINQIVDNTVQRIMMLYALVCGALLFIVYPITRTITYRIALLRKQMQRVSEGTLSKLIMTDDYQDEIGQLIVHYNQMVGKVEELLGEQYALGQEKTEAELKALQSQINPHFLYNTLDMINWMAQKGENDNIRSVIQAMSLFYRQTLSKGKDIIRIRDEIKMCQAYMEIQKRRYKGKIRYEEEVQEEIMDYLIPKITLQPFLENAIIHGIHEKEDSRGVVILNGWLEDEMITLSVTDDGKGMRMEDKDNAISGSHYGLENIEKRLSMFYKQEIPITIESSLGIGTCIMITIPIVKALE